MSVCMSAVSAGISEVLIKYTGKYVNIYFIMKITFSWNHSDHSKLTCWCCQYDYNLLRHIPYTVCSVLLMGLQNESFLIKKII